MFLSQGQLAFEHVFKARWEENFSQQPPQSRHSIEVEPGLRRQAFFEVGDVPVRGKTIPEIRDLLTDRFRKVVPAATVTLFLVEGGVLVDEAPAAGSG